jgi:CHAD domain-containing protein
VKPAENDRSYRLRADEALGEGLARIGVGRAEQALERLDGLAPGDPRLADAVHGARKDMKKLRAVVRLLRDGLGERRCRKENGRYRDAARALAASRDAEVKVEALEGLIERVPELPPGVFAWRQLLERERDEAASGAEGAAVAEARELIAGGRERIRGWELGEEGWRLIHRSVLRTYARGRRALREAEADASEENLHEWRKRAKDLWYELRVLGEAWPELLDPTAEQAHRLSDLLGDHHDLALLRSDLGRRRFDAETTALLEVAILGAEGGLTEEALRLGRRLYAEPPKQFRRRLRGYWKAWRG